MGKIPEPGRPVAASRELLRMMGGIIANGEMYGPLHKVTIESIDKSFKFLQPILEICERINFDMSNGVLLVEGEPAGTNELFINTLAKRLNEVELAGLALLKGLTKEEFGKLIEIMFTGVPVADVAGEGMRRALAEYGVEHISAQTVTYRTITEQEEVILKGAHEAPARGGEDAKIIESGQERLIEQISAFLKGDSSVDDEHASKDLATLLLSDPERLARFIMESAVTQPKKVKPSGEPESLADILVIRLNRVRCALLKDNSAASIKRKVALQKNLLLLGKTILRSVKNLGISDAPDAETAIPDAIRQMMSEIEIKATASEYAKKHASFTKVEKDLIAQIKDVGVEIAIEGGLGKQLAGEGVPDSSLRMLLEKAGELAVPGGVSEIVALLTKLEEAIRVDKGEGNTRAGARAQLNKITGILEENTRQKIEILGKQIQRLNEEPDQTKRKQTLKNLLILLAEILQELCQPVTVMSGVIQMISAGYLGPVNDQLKEMVEMAIESGTSAKELLDRLVMIVGVPKGLSPDRELLASGAPLIPQP